MISATNQVIYDGLRNVTTIHSGLCDGADGLNETSVVKVDVSTLSPASSRVKVMNIQYDVGPTGVVQMAWEATPPVPFAYLTNTGSEFDYEPEGGLLNNADTTGTGNILLTAIGFEQNSSYTVRLRMRKKDSKWGS